MDNSPSESSLLLSKNGAFIRSLQSNDSSPKTFRQLPASYSHASVRSVENSPRLFRRRSMSFTSVDSSAGSAKMLSLSNRSLSIRGGGASIPASVEVEVASSLNVQTWILPALICALSYAFYNISIKKASNDINPILGGVILQFVAAIIGTIIYLCERGLMEQEGAETLMNSTGIYWSIAAGAFVGIAEILSFVVNGKGVPATQSIPVIIGGSVFFGAVLGNLWLAEDVSYRGWLGIFLIVLGITFVGMEPGVSSG